jgi:hypothetical protein
MHKLKVMRTLKRRIEELEKATLALRHDRARRVERAIWHLGTDQMEFFLSSFAAEHEGRPLTPAESAAQQAYTRALEAECRSTLSSRAWPRASPAFEEFLMGVAEQPFSAEVFKLALIRERGQQKLA